MSAARQSLLARGLASGGGIGFFPWAPGTMGSLLAALLGAGLLWLSPFALAGGVLAAFLGGLWAVPLAGGEADPGWVVIDEFAGQWLTLLALAAPSPPRVALGFALFRLFDIWKPWPIRVLDRRHDALGVMSDDVVAGLFAGVVLGLITRLSAIV